MKIKPIKTKSDYKNALSEVERLWGAKSRTADGDKLDVLITLIAAYEEGNHPIPPPDPIEAILFRMEQEGLSRADLARIIGSRSRVTEILNRTRGLSLPMIRKLHRELRIPAQVLIMETSSRRGASKPSAQRKTKTVPAKKGKANHLRN